MGSVLELLGGYVFFVPFIVLMLLLAVTIGVTSVFAAFVWVKLGPQAEVHSKQPQSWVEHSDR